MNKNIIYTEDFDASGRFRTKNISFVWHNVPCVCQHIYFIVIFQIIHTIAHQQSPSFSTLIQIENQNVPYSRITWQNIPGSTKTIKYTKDTNFHAHICACNCDIKQLRKILWYDHCKIISVWNICYWFPKHIIFLFNVLLITQK